MNRTERILSQSAEILRLYQQEKLSAREIGLRLSMCRSSVLRVLAGNDVVIRPTGPPPQLTETEKLAKKRWDGMINRCYNPKSRFFVRYGGRGIGICDEWRTHPRAFVAWAIASGFSPELQIDRIDNDKGYSPDNCRWVTCSDNLRNKSTNILLTIDDETKTIAAWLEDRRCRVSNVTLRARINSGWDAKAAVFSPPIPHGYRRNS